MAILAQTTLPDSAKVREYFSKMAKTAQQRAVITAKIIPLEYWGNSLDRKITSLKILIFEYEPQVVGE
jgi:hypothetical protein